MQAPTRLQVYSCIYDEYKGFILYLYLQVTTDFVLTIIGATCHFLVADVLSAGTCPSQDFRSETYFQKLCDSINGYNILTVDANSRGTARRIILKLSRGARGASCLSIGPTCGARHARAARRAIDVAVTVTLCHSF